MQYTGTIIRPPVEANSILLQVAVGCSYNTCTFCGVYKDVSFRIKSSSEIDEDLQFAKTYCRKQKRVFLTDGDVLALSQNRLVDLFKKIKIHLSWISRISLYGSAKSVLGKTRSELTQLQSLGLDRVYLGLESGNEEILKSVKKGSSPQDMVEAGNVLRASGLFCSVTALLGLGGVLLSKQHAIDTADVLNKMRPKQIGMLTYMPLANTELGQEVKNNSFQMLGSHGILEELYLLLSNVSLDRCQFHANHASNYLPISGRLAKDKKLLLSTIKMALEGSMPVVPEHRRAL